MVYNKSGIVKYAGRSENQQKVFYCQAKNKRIGNNLCELVAVTLMLERR